MALLAHSLAAAFVPAFQPKERRGVPRVTSTATRVEIIKERFRLRSKSPSLSDPQLFAVLIFLWIISTIY
jgi:hypothetical protein